MSEYTVHKEYEQSIFSVAHTDIRISPFGNAGRTLRLVVESNVNAYALSVRFANWCGEGPLDIGAASIGLCDEKGVLQAGTLKPLTVGGVLHFTLAQGECIQSDVLTFPIKPHDYIALNIYYPTEEKVISGNWVSNNAQRSKPGNFSADLSLPGPRLVSRLARTVASSDMTVSITSVQDIIAHTEKPHRVVGCFGDSITQQGNWSVPFTKLLYRKYPGEISVCNLGISGNRLLADSPDFAGALNGISGIARFSRDLLNLRGLTHAILEIGSNDLGLPGGQGIPDAELPSPEEYILAMTSLADRLHERAVKVYTATISPRPITGPSTLQRDALRLHLNEWIRSAACFDAVLDFDAVLRRDDGEPGIKERHHLPDRLHPSPWGGLWMAKSIDLSLFGGAVS